MTAVTVFAASEPSAPGSFTPTPPTTKSPTSGPPPPPVAWGPVIAAIVACVTALAVTSNRYGYHRDELYFRMLKPAWGYVDQPPLTPLLARAASRLFNDTLWGLRIPATICVAVAVLLVVLITRELGGGRAAQTLCAWGFGFAGLPLIFGHVMLTATVDFPLWSGVILCAIRALRREAPRWWLGAGVLVGVATYNKLLIVMLLIGLAVGLLTVGPRRWLRSPWLWAGAGLALLIGAPNLVYQATHDFPQLTMASALSDNKGGEARVQLLPFQVLLIGPPLLAIWVAGLVALLRRREWRPVRAFAVAYLVVLALTFISGGQPYYPFGLQALLFAAGCVPTVDWIARRHTTLRRALVIAAVVLNSVVSVLIALPGLPVSVLARTPVPAINQVMRDQVGWPTYVAEIAAVYRGLPAADQAAAVIIAVNYGQAGAVSRFGPAQGLPTVYSGQNQLWYDGPPPQSATVAIVLGGDQSRLQSRFASCVAAGTLDNLVDIDNEEQGRTIWVCREPRGGWATQWPAFQHYS